MANPPTTPSLGHADVMRSMVAAYGMTPPSSCGQGELLHAVSVAIGGFSPPINTGATATVSSPVITSGVAFTPSPTCDCQLSWNMNAIDYVTLTMGPTTGAENMFLDGNWQNSTGDVLTFRVPGGWKVIITMYTSIASINNFRVLTFG